MGTTKLKVFNEALRVLGERRLTALDSPATEQSQIELDAVWDDGAVDYCLEKGLWNFAIKEISLTYDPDTTRQFGYTHAFNKPSDFIRTAAVSADENFSVALLDYRDASTFWYSNFDTLYFLYVSNDSTYGGDLSEWPQTFVKFVGAYLAYMTCTRITGSKITKAQAKEEMDEKLSDAKAKDAIANPTRIPESGSWVRSRGGRTGDRGSRRRLIG